MKPFSMIIARVGGNLRRGRKRFMGRDHREKVAFRLTILKEMRSVTGPPKNAVF